MFFHSSAVSDALSPLLQDEIFGVYLCTEKGVSYFVRFSIISELLVFELHNNLDKLSLRRISMIERSNIA